MWLALLIFPSALTFAQDAPTTIEMTDGSVFIGTIIDATVAALWLEDETGEVTALARDDIRGIYGKQPEALSTYANPKKGPMPLWQKAAISVGVFIGTWGVVTLIYWYSLSGFL